jgi:hypothetical protein
VSEDPAGDPNSPNLYSYCGNNPVGFVDSTGNYGYDVQTGEISFADGTIIDTDGNVINEPLGGSSYVHGGGSSDSSNGSGSSDDYINSHIQEDMNYLNDVAKRLDDSIDRDRNTGIGGFGGGDSDSWDNISKAIEEVFSHTSGYGDTNGDGYGPGIGSFSGGIGSNIRDVIGSIIGYNEKMSQKEFDKAWKETEKYKDIVLRRAKLLERQFPGFKYNPNSPTPLATQFFCWQQSKIDYSKCASVKTGISGTALHQTVAIYIDWGQHKYGVSYSISVNTALGASLDLSYTKAGANGSHEVIAGYENMGFGINPGKGGLEGGALHIGAAVSYSGPEFPLDYNYSTSARNWSW